MPINSFLYPGAKATPPVYEVANSCRFNDSDSAYLNKTFSSAGNRRTFTYSCWLKRGNLDISSTYNMRFFGSSDSLQFWVHPNTVGKLNINIASGELTTNRLFRDVSAWYHIVLAVDTTQSTSSNRLKLYINGTQETSFSTESYPSQNAESSINNNVEHSLGRQLSTSRYYDGYMAECVFIDGQQLDPTSFGEFDSDSPTIWKPKDVSGLTFGTNGFYLDFEDSSSLGNDAAGSNNFTANNLAATDQSIDTCTNNFATWNPLDNYYSNSTFSEGNLRIATGTSENAANVSTIGVSTGKWYMEIKVVSKSSGNDDYLVGIIADQYTANNQNLGNTTGSYAYYAYNGNSRTNNSTSSYGNSYAAGDIIGIALDLDNNKLYFSKNGTFQNSGDPTSGSTGTGAISITDPSSQPLGVYFFAATLWQNTAVGTFDGNFGSPSFTISSGNTDGNGYGNFEYAVPSSYYSLNTKNLAEFG